MKALPIDEVRAAIMRGDVDGHLTDIVAVVRDRMRLLDAKAAQEQSLIPAGTVVRIGGRISPRYLIGQRVKIVGPARRRGCVTIEWERPEELRLISRDRYGLGKTCDVPAACLERVPEERR